MPRSSPASIGDTFAGAIRAARVVLTDDVVLDAVVTIENGKITQIASAEPGREVSLDLPSATLLPGVIDVHVHGSGGWRIGSGDNQDRELAGMRRALAGNGVTGFLPTIATASDQVTTEALDSVRRAMEVPSDDGAYGAMVLGSHLEGPYLNPKRKGAMQPEFIRLPDRTHFERLSQASGGTLEYLTMAPELPGASALIESVRERGVFVSAGHTDATADETHRAFAQGVQGVTHLFNAMRGLHHREPGVVGAALAAPSAWVELIGDGIHVHPDVMRLAIAVKGSKRVVIVSDAGRYAGLPPGRYEEAHRTVIVDGLRCTLPDGTLAGSASPMNRNLMLLHHELGLPWTAVAAMTATNPASMLGIEQETGSLGVGKRADLIALDDHGRVLLTLVRGRIAHRADEPAQST